MKSLSLYVDKWFISVAINIDGNVMPLSLPSGEDRIWLFFHEDIPNNRIEYGKAFENNYRDRRPHFIGDIFALITEGDNYFTRYEKRQEEMKEIFNVSCIFSHLHQAIDDDGPINTYISFSSDISYVARLRFIEELEEHNFKVVESVARISLLALEESKRSQALSKLGTYLVLAATNENFHYSLYENKGDIFLRLKEGSLPGLGLDMRRRALVEMIVENINHNSKLLRSREEVELECIRQDRFASKWLDQIAKTKLYMPTALEGITFAVAPNNPAVVQILPNILDDRTSGLVDDIVRKIADFIRDSQLDLNEIEGIVFLGNTFTNQTFAKAIKSRLVISNDSLVTYREDELPKIVNVYSQIDCSQFKEPTAKFYEDAHTQAALMKLAKEEAEKKRMAEEENRRQQEMIDSQKKAEMAYKEAVEKIERYESEHNYDEMLAWTEIALKNRPDDEYGKEKGELARRRQAELLAALKNFNSFIQRANTAFTEERWSDVISQCDMALEIQPNSVEAANRKKEARRRIDANEEIQNRLNRAHMYFAQKSYDEASREIDKILNLDPSNKEAHEIITNISEIHTRHREKLEELISRLNEAEEGLDFTLALQLCDNLSEEDADNAQYWVNKKNSISRIKHETEESMRVKNEIKLQIYDACKNKEWHEVIRLCKEYLIFDEDAEVSNLLNEAQSAIALHEIQSEFNDAVESEDWTRVLSIYNANPVLREISSNNSIVHLARRQLHIQRSNRKKQLQNINNLEDTADIDDSEGISIRRLRRRKSMPQTLIEEVNPIIINANGRKKEFPRPNRNTSTTPEIKQADTTINENRMRKYPKVSRKN